MSMVAHGHKGAWVRRVRMLAVLLFAGALLLGGCAGGQPEGPPKPSEEELARQAEEQAKQEAERKRLEEERRKAEEKRQREEMVALVGSLGEPPSIAPVPPPQPQGIPFDEAVPPLPAEPTVRVAVLAHGPAADKAEQVALILGTYERDRLEERLGMAVKIAYVARRDDPLPRDSEIHYRPDFLRAAQSMATALSAQQWIGPMTMDEARQRGVDVVVHVGEHYR